MLEIAPPKLATFPGTANDHSNGRKLGWQREIDKVNKETIFLLHHTKSSSRMAPVPATMRCQRQVCLAPKLNA